MYGLFVDGCRHVSFRDSMSLQTCLLSMTCSAGILVVTYFFLLRIAQRCLELKQDNVYDSHFGPACQIACFVYLPERNI